MGFTINGLTSQNTITSSTNYSYNLPLEGYIELDSLDAVKSILYADFKAGAEIVGQPLATSLGLSNRYFFLGQFAAGIQFAQSVSIGFQYIQGPKAIYALPASTTGTAPPTSISGFHFVVSFTKPPAKTTTPSS